jgi:outer membrane protein OmpA-like peptidoglycan-associated protein
MKIFRLSLLLFFVAFALTDASAQKDKKESAPKSSWAAGLSGGPTFMFCDVASQFKGYVIDLNISKALSAHMSLRAQLGLGNTYGLHNLPAFGQMITKNSAINGTIDPTVNYQSDVLFHNYKMNFKEASLNGLYFFPLSDFRKSEYRSFGIYLFAGVGGMIYKTTIDQLNANGNEYNYAPITTLPKEDIQKELKSILDGTYETDAEVDNNHVTEMMGGYFIPILNGGMGIDFKITKRIDIFIEGRYTWTGNDLIDGSRWQLDGSLTGNDDAPINASIGFNYRFGNTDNIFWFDNPEAMQYKITLQNKRKIDQLSNDTDGDGVADQFDKDPETPSGVAVDGSGKPMDIDNDGIYDYKDSDPFSDKNAVVDSTGVAIDSDLDGVPDHRDLEPNTVPGQLVNFQGKRIKVVSETVQTGTITPLGFIPVVFFDFNQAYIRPEFFNSILELAMALKQYPNDKLKIIGHTDAVGDPEYNIELGKRRAQAVVDLLVGSGVKRERIFIESKGEAQPLSVVSNADLNRLNRRVQFEVVPGGMMQEPPKDKKDDKKKTEENKDLDDLFKSE